MTDNIDIQLIVGGAALTVRDEDTNETETWIMDREDTAKLADLATQAFAEMKGWEFHVCPAIAVEVGNVLAFVEGTVVGAGTIYDGRTTELYFDNGLSMELDSALQVTILRRIA